MFCFFFFSSRRRHTRYWRDWSSDVCSSDLVYDDIDLDIGKLRIRKKGSAGSHNGMKSIIKCLGSQEFPRVRVGVSRPEPGRDLADFVLSRVSKEKQADMDSAIDRAASTVEEIIKNGLDMAMNKYNG